MAKESTEDLLKELGWKPLPDDHPIWNEGTVIQFSQGLLPAQRETKREFSIRANRRLLPALLLGVLGPEALFEVTRETGKTATTFLRIVPANLLASPEALQTVHDYRRVSYRRLSNRWLDKLFKEKTTWTGQARTGGLVPQPSDLRRLRGAWYVAFQRDTSRSGKITRAAAVRGDRLLPSEHDDVQGPYGLASTASRLASQIMEMSPRPNEEEGETDRRSASPAGLVLPARWVPFLAQEDIDGIVELALAGREKEIGLTKTEIVNRLVEGGFEGTSPLGSHEAWYLHSEPSIADFNPEVIEDDLDSDRARALLNGAAPTAEEFDLFVQRTKEYDDWWITPLWLYELKDSQSRRVLMAMRSDTWHSFDGGPDWCEYDDRFYRSSVEVEEQYSKEYRIEKIL
jgi:hypothetical protein